MKTENIVEKYNSILPFVSVIIPTYHDWKRLQLCLNALDKQVYPKSHFEVLVVNNDPSDTPPSSLVVPKNCKLLSELKPGSYAARNKALSVAKGEIYAFTDSDCQPETDWLEVAVRFFSRNHEVDRIGGKILLYPKNLKKNLAEAYSMDFELQQEKIVGSTNAAMTANMITKSYVFEKVGPFNDKLLSLGDMEWGNRAESSGFKIEYLKDCVVRHPARHTLKELRTKNKRMVGGFVSLKSNKDIFLAIASGFLPPIRAVLNVKKENYSYQGIAVLYYLKIMRTIEIIKVIKGGDLERK